MKSQINNQDKLVKFIDKYVSENNYPPTIREMCKAINVKSTSTVAYYLNKLTESGRIKKQPNRNRALGVIQAVDRVKEDNVEKINPNINMLEKIDYSNVNPIPVLGKITAGEPILAVENCEEYYMASPNMFRGNDLFMLTVSGESMIEAGIYNGDKVILKQQTTAVNGEIIAAMIDGCATVKRFYKENGHYRLQPENSTMNPIFTDHVEIIGKVVGLVRKF